MCIVRVPVLWRFSGISIRQKNLFKNAREELDSWFGGPERKISHPSNQKLTACMLSQWAQTNLSNRGLIVLFIILWSTLAPIWVFLMCLGFFAVMHGFFFCYLFVCSPFCREELELLQMTPLDFKNTPPRFMDGNVSHCSIFSNYSPFTTHVSF